MKQTKKMLDSDSTITRDKDNIPANITGLYLKTLLPDTHKEKEFNFNLFYCGDLTDSSKGLTSTTVHGQTCGTKSILGDYDFMLLYNTRAYRNATDDALQKAVYDIKGYDRLIVRKDCLIKGLPCEKCYKRTYKFFTNLCNDLKSGDDKCKDLYGNYVDTENYWEIKTFTRYIKGIDTFIKNCKDEDEKKKKEKERLEIVNRGYIECKSCNKHICIHELFLTKNKGQKTMMCMGCVIMRLKKYLDKDSNVSIKESKKLAAEKGRKPKVCTPFMVPEGLIPDVDFLSIKEFKEYEAEIKKDDKNTYCTYAIKIYDKEGIDGKKYMSPEDYKTKLDDMKDEKKSEENSGDAGDGGKSEKEDKGKTQKVKVNRKSTMKKGQAKRKTLKVQKSNLVEKKEEEEEGENEGTK